MATRKKFSAEFKVKVAWAAIRGDVDGLDGCGQASLWPTVALWSWQFPAATHAGLVQKCRDQSKLALWSANYYATPNFVLKMISHPTGRL